MGPDMTLDIDRMVKKLWCLQKLLAKLNLAYSPYQSSVEEDYDFVYRMLYLRRNKQDARADIFKKELITRELVYFLKRVGLLRDDEFVAIARILIGRIDKEMKDASDQDNRQLWES